MSKLRIRAEKIEAAHLSPGDLYSDQGPDHWNEVVADLEGNFGTEIYMRTLSPTTNEMIDKTVYKLTIISASQSEKRGPRIQFSMNPSAPPGIKDWKP